MEIVFRGLTKEVGPKDIYYFVMDGLKTFGVSINVPLIDRCEVLEVYDKHQREFKYLGVVRFQNPSIGERAMRKLRCKLSKGKFVQMREFFHCGGSPMSSSNGQDDNIAEVSCTPSLTFENRHSQVVTKRSSFSL